jgi:PQQ-like domain
MTARLRFAPLAQMLVFSLNFTLILAFALASTGCGSSGGSGSQDPPPPPPAAATDVPTWHFDNGRSGLNATETALTPQTVSPQTFGKLFSYNVDGYVYAQPLVVGGLTVNGATHNVVFVVTENDSAYAFDADSYGSGTPLWQVSLLKSGETPLTNGPIQPVEGVTSTPVIDVASKTMYVVSMQTSGGTGTFRLHALNITTGAETSGSPVEVEASVPGTNQDSQDGIVYLTTACLQRAALLLANGSIFMGFGSCHSGWLLAYDEKTLAQTGVFNMSPNLNGEGPYASAGGVWMGGGGPVADGSGNVYISTGNGPYDGQTAFGESVMKFDSQLHLLDHFTPYDYEYMDCADADLAAGGLLLIPGSTEALAGGKTGKLYLVNTTDLGGEQPKDEGATQTLWFEPDLAPPYSKSCVDPQGNTWTTDINSYEIFGTAAYFNGTAYLGITPTLSTVPGPLRAFAYNGQLTAGAYTSDNILQGSYGTTPFISADGSAGGVVWMIDHGNPLQQSGTSTVAILRAYDSGSLTEIYNSDDNGGDAPGYGIKFTSPIVTNGKVYMGTGHDPLGGPNPQGELDVYGLKNQ